MKIDKKKAAILRKRAIMEIDNKGLTPKLQEYLRFLNSYYKGDNEKYPI